MIALEEKYEQLKKLIEALISSSESGAAIIVEGRKDESSLRRLGVRKGIFCLKALNKNFHDFMFEVEKAKEAILMVDFDKEGKKMAKKLIEELTRSKVKVNDSVWRRVRNLTRPEVKGVEELADYIEKISRRASGEKF